MFYKICNEQTRLDTGKYLKPFGRVSRRVNSQAYDQAPGLIFGGASIRRGLFTEGNLRFKTDWAGLIVGSRFTVFTLFYFVFEGNFSSTSPWGGLYLEGRFNGGFFALPVWEAYIWRGLYMEGLIFGILRYLLF